MEPVLVACSHGTRAAAGRAVMDALRDDLRRARPELAVEAAHVDVHGPWLGEVVAGLTAQGRAAVVVPLLLSSGYHVKVDIAEVVERSGGLAVAAAALGPDPALVAILAGRLAEAGAGPDDAVVLAAAGSSDPAARGDVEGTAAALAELRGTPVTPAYLAASPPTVPDAVAALRAAEPGRGVSIATYLLAPGLFSARLPEVGADRVTAPLAPHPSLTALALSRYDEAVRVPAGEG